MLEKRRRNGIPHGIEDKVYSLAAREFGGRHKVGITGDQDNPIDEALQCQRGDIHAEFHINTLLPDIAEYVSRRQLLYGDGSSQQFAKPIRTNVPSHISLQVTEAEGDFAQFLEFLKQSESKHGRWRLGKINRLFRYGILRLFLQWRAIVVKNPVKIPVTVLESYFVQGFGDLFRRMSLSTRKAACVAVKEKGPINQHCRIHSRKKQPLGSPCSG